MNKNYELTSAILLEISFGGMGAKVKSFFKRPPIVKPGIKITGDRSGFSMTMGRRPIHGFVTPTD